MGCPLTVSIAGPVTVSGQHLTWLIPLLETGWVAYLSTTDAVCYHDGHRSLDEYTQRPDSRSADLDATTPQLRDEGTIRVTDMAFDEGVLLDQDRFLSAVLRAARVPEEDDRHRAAVPARARTTPRRRSGTACRPGCCRRATGSAIPVFVGAPADGSVFLNSMKLWAHEAGRPDAGVRLRARPARRSVRGLRVPSLGPVRPVRRTRSRR